MGNEKDNGQVLDVEAVHHALRAWQNTSGTSEDLLSFLLLVQEQQTAAFPSADPPLLRRATNEILLQAVEALAKQDPIKADILRMRFIENTSARNVAYHLNYTPDTVYRQQREAIDALTGILTKWEMERRKDRANALLTDLPPATYSQLFGIHQQQQDLSQRLLDRDQHHLLSIVGLGGIGKTSLADAVVRQVIPHFYFTRILWLRLESDTLTGRFPAPEIAYQTLLDNLSQMLWPDEATRYAQNERLTRIRYQLSQAPHLIVIDNLEDPDDTAYLLAQLHDFVRPSKVLVTSRVRPQTATPVYLLTLQDLQKEDAESLIRHHAQEKGLTAVATMDDADLQEIYETIGGNPYALKLVVDLLDLHPLPSLLQQLSQGGDGSPQQLYAHIYRQIWQTLTANAKLLLQAFLLTGDRGGDASQLQQITGLNEQFWPALQELRHRSLVEVRGTLHQRRYGIHRLTDTFLRTDVTGWDDSADT